jgi:hypothetical protein
MRKSEATTPLAELYQQLVDTGAIQPANEAGQFRYPSMRIVVPSVTTYGVHDYRGLGEELRAQLERHIK